MTHTVYAIMDYQNVSYATITMCLLKTIQDHTLHNDHQTIRLCRVEFPMIYGPYLMSYENCIVC